MDIVINPVSVALMLAAVIILIFWPERAKGPVEDYLRILSPLYWREETDIYEEILNLHPMFGLQEHNDMLCYLVSKKKVERRIESPYSLKETESPNRFSEVYVDHREPFGAVIAVRYRLLPRIGGTRRRSRMSFRHAAA